MAEFSFDWGDFVTAYPAFNSIPELNADSFWVIEAIRVVSSYVQYNDNNPQEFTAVVYAVLAYVLSLYVMPTDPASANMGAISAAREGDVSVNVQLPTKLTDSFWGKNNYGQLALMMLRKYTLGGSIVSGKTIMDITDV